MTLRRAGDRRGRRIALMPDFLAVGGIEAGEHLVGILPGEDIEPIADQRRRGIAFADFLPPFLRQLLGPRRRRGKAGDFSIAIGPAPLRPVLREDGGGGNSRGQSHGQMSMPLFHGCSGLSFQRRQHENEMSLGVERPE